MMLNQMEEMRSEFTEQLIQLKSQLAEKKAVMQTSTTRSIMMSDHASNHLIERNLDDIASLRAAEVNKRCSWPGIHG